MLILSVNQRAQLSNLRFQLQQQDAHLQQLNQKLILMKCEEASELQQVIEKMLQENRYQLQYLEGILR